MSACPNCGAETRSGQKFCAECGLALAARCPTCSAEYEPGDKFCRECGTPLGAGQAVRPPASPAAPVVAAPAAERRLVTVLFADLVGFTTLSESRDSEEVRELLSRYFELARTLIARYGGTVEKFIGDAVMAVWGTPTATEDDAERAVRAALDIVSSIPDLDRGLRARAGVLTGEAAVTIGATGEGMVAGDLVNTAARIQAAAEPGGVLVGDSTRRASEQTIAYESTGTHELKGKAEPMDLFRALRVVSGIGGSLKSAGLEAPFVGRDRELKLMKDLFHACASDHRAHLASVIGVAGIGKSRLGWEFYKYFDGIVDTVWWHRGRCLAYGDGVTYWALADMVRMRCRIAEDDENEAARQKLSATVHEHVLDAGEREFVEPRLAQLLGLEERPGSDRQDLFPAWRLFFERLASTSPCVLLFEDTQWADPGLLDFIEHLLEWSRDHAIYVITLARPELQERRPSWGAGQRSFTSLYLDPLAADAMNDLLDGLVPGLPTTLREQILARASGIPLYAVETVRMLLDRGLLTEDGPFYKPVGEIDSLEVPETLHSLIAARLDGVSPDERLLLQDGAVLGKTFTAAAVAALAGRGEGEITPLLAGLVRKEVLGLQADPRSPEHGQYGFLQDLVRHVAYETLSKHERKQRHLAAAGYLEGAFPGDDEVAEVLASHYLAAIEAVPGADDEADIRARAAQTLIRAAERAASLGSLEQAQRSLDRAAALTSAPTERAALLARAGHFAENDGRTVDARTRCEQALQIYEEAGDIAAVAGVTLRLAQIDFLEGHTDAATARLEAVLPALEDSGPSPILAEALGQLGRMRALQGDYSSPVMEILERALAMAGSLALDEIVMDGLITRAIILEDNGRMQEAILLARAVVDKARADGLNAVWSRGVWNLGATLDSMDEFDEVVRLLDEMAEHERRVGSQERLVMARLGQVAALYLLGRWSEALAIADEVREMAASEFARGAAGHLVFIHCGRGNVDEAARTLAAIEWMREAPGDWFSSFAGFEASLLLTQGKPRDALAAARRGLPPYPMSPTRGQVKWCFEAAMEAALELGELGTAAELLQWAESLTPGDVTPMMHGHVARFRARLDAATGHLESVEPSFRRAEEIYGERSLVFLLASTQLEHAEWLVGQGRPDEAEPLLTEARQTFERLEAAPWLERAGGQAVPEAAAAGA